MPAPRIAIVGSGPSGCYTAQALRRELGADAGIEIFEALDTPYGLARFGVAADHPGTRAVTKQFDRLFARDGVVLHCSTPVGGESGIPISTLRADFDAVVLATGLPDDLLAATAGSLGEPSPRHIGAGRLLRTLNNHPELRVDPEPLGPVAVIVGAGNVAMDVIRLLARPLDELAGIGINEVALASFREGLTTLHVVARSLPDAIAADVAMLREITAIDGVEHRVRVATQHEHDAPGAVSTSEGAGAALGEGDRAQLLREAVTKKQGDDGPRLRIEWWFGFAPSEMGHAATSGATPDSALVIAPRAFATDTAHPAHREHAFTLAADTIVSAIGFTRTPDEFGPHADEEVSVTGRIEPGLYAAGWLRRGPRGTIPSQRTDARELATLIAGDLSKQVASHDASTP